MSIKLMLNLISFKKEHIDPHFIELKQSMGQFL